VRVVGYCVRPEPELLKGCAHPEQQSLGSERAGPKEDLTHPLAVDAVRLDVVVIEADDHRRVVMCADEMRPEGNRRPVATMLPAQTDQHQLPTIMGEHVAPECRRKLE